MKIAEIRKGMVVIIKDPDETPNIGTWVDIPEQQDVSIGDLYINGAFVSPPTNLFLHVSTNRSPSYLTNNGIDTLIITGTLRQSSDPNSNIITEFTGKDWYIPIRDSNGKVYEIPTISFIDGIGTIDFQSLGRPEICHIDQQDIIQIEMNEVTYNIHLTGKLKFLIKS